MATASQPGQGIKNGMKILVIGHNGVGKSSLINEILGKNRATVGDSVKPTEHTELVEEIHHTVGENNDIPVTVYDTRGFGDPKIKNRSIINSAKSKVKEADVILICHKLYDRFDESSEKLLQEMVGALGNTLMQHAIIVFTFGDEYLIRCKESNDTEKAKEHIEKQETAVKQEMKRYLIKNKISQEIVRDIPSIVTSSRKNTLPTNEDGSKNWVIDFWASCAQRCTRNAAEFVAWYKQYYWSLIFAVGGTGAVTGAAVGAAIGGTLIPGIGAVAGALIGSGIGLVTGGTGGMGVTAAGVMIAETTKDEKEDKKNN